MGTKVGPVAQQLIRNVYCKIDETVGEKVAQATAELFLDVKTVRKALKQQVDKRSLRETWATKVRLLKIGGGENWWR